MSARRTRCWPRRRRSAHRARERRALHLALAGVVADEELRARHVALATDHPDAALADTVAAAAADASARGAVADAVQLATQALRLTPPELEERSERLLTLAGYLETAGERRRVTDLLTPELDALPPGGARVRAWLLLSEGGDITTYADHGRHIERALAETMGAPELRAHVLATKAINTAAEGVERIPEAEAWALEALSQADLAGPEVERLALRGLGWARALRGQPIDDVCERFAAASDAVSHITDSPEPVHGPAVRLARRGRRGAHDARAVPHARRRARRSAVVRVAAAEHVRARPARGRLGRSWSGCWTSGRRRATSSC